METLGLWQCETNRYISGQHPREWKWEAAATDPRGMFQVNTILIHVQKLCHHCLVGPLQ